MTATPAAIFGPKSGGALEDFRLCSMAIIRSLGFPAPARHIAEGMGPASAARRHADYPPILWISLLKTADTFQSPNKSKDFIKLHKN